MLWVLHDHEAPPLHFNVIRMNMHEFQKAVFYIARNAVLPNIYIFHAHCPAGTYIEP